MALLGLAEVVECSETVVHELDGVVDVALLHLVAEVELRHGLRDSNDAEQCSRSDVHVADFLLALSLQLTLLDVASHNVLVKCLRDDRLKLLSLRDE